MNVPDLKEEFRRMFTETGFVVRDIVLTVPPANRDDIVAEILRKSVIHGGAEISYYKVVTDLGPVFVGHASFLFIDLQASGVSLHDLGESALDDLVSLPGIVEFSEVHLRSIFMILQQEKR